MASPPSSTTSTTSQPRWYVPTPAKFLFGVLVMQGVLFLSAHYRWFWFNERKGYTVLITVAATAMALLLLVAAVFVSRFLKSKSQFGLATLLLMVPVMGIPCAWLAQELDAAERQRWIAVTIRNRGGTTNIAYASDGPKWLTRLFGDCFFVDIRRVEFLDSRDTDIAVLAELPNLELVNLATWQGRSQVTNAGLSHLQHSKQLKWLDLSETQITDEGLVHLKSLSQLQAVSLRGLPITDYGLQHLSTLREISSLDLSQTQVTDDGLKHLCKLGKLHSLYLSQTHVTDVGTEQVRVLTDLNELDLSELPISNAGLRRLDRLRNLVCLNLGGTRITDDGLGPLEDFAELSVLSLSNTQFTDRGLDRLKGIKKLIDIDLTATEVTEAAVDEFRRARPDVIVHNNWTDE